MKSLEVKKSVDVLIIHNDDEEKESTRDALIRRQTDKMETLQELTVSAQDAHSSSDKETLKELMASDPTPSSSIPKTKRDQFCEMETGLKSTMKQVLHSMVDERVNEIAKKTVPLYVAGGLLLDRQKIQTDMANMIAEA
ncbi:hypothetical protein Tco_1477259 [Tanacetum coccineum]